MAGLQARRQRRGWLYIGPALLFVSLVVLVPFGQLIALSLSNQSLLGGGHFVGFDNYWKMWNDSSFWRALGFTLRYTLWLTPILMGLGYALALLLVDNTPLKRATRTIVFLPVVIGLGSSSLLWLWLFNEQVGLFNKALVDLHVISAPIVWFIDSDVAFWAVSISVTWKVIGFGTVLFVAGIQSINPEILEAALMDGAGYWSRVWRIILPLTRQVLLLTTLISIIGSLLALDQFYVMTAGGPRGQTFTAVYWIYQNSFVTFKLGYGAALSVVLTAIIMALSALQIVLGNRGKAQ